MDTCQTLEILRKPAHQISHHNLPTYTPLKIKPSAQMSDIISKLLNSRRVKLRQIECFSVL